MRFVTRPRSLAALSLVAAVVACVPGALAGTRKAHVHVFTTSLAGRVTLAAPYVWTFNPGVPTKEGYFFADGRLLGKIAGPGPYRFELRRGMLSLGVHRFGHAWDLLDGAHRTPAHAFRLRIVRAQSHTKPRVSRNSHASTTPAHTSRRWAAATAFSRPAFTPTRRIEVSSASAFWSAWNAIRPGDEIDVHGVTFSGEQSFNTQLSGWAEVRFDSGTRFTGTPGQNLPDVWIDGASHVRFYGGDLTNPQGGAGVMIYDASYVTWWGFDIHGTGGTGLFVTGVHRANDHLDLKGTISRWGLNLGFDPHQEKGTGLHGANLADAYYGVEDSRFALHLENGSVGAGVEAGGKTDGDFFRNNTLYLWCQNLTMRATSQIGGNCLQVWGEHVTGNDVAYLEAENLQGRPYDANGMYAGQSLASDTVHIGPASRTNLNPALAQTESSVGRSVRWDPRHGTRFVP